MAKSALLILDVQRKTVTAFGVLAEGEFDLGLFEHGVCAAQSVYFGVRKQFEAMQPVVEIGERFRVRPTSL